MSTSNGPANTDNQIINTNTPTLYNINTSNVTKLTNTNYLMWTLQTHALLDGYELSGFLDESTLVSSETVTVANVTTVNPDFTLWKRQDKLIYSALLGAISPSVQQLVSRATTSSQIWATLASTFATPSRGHVNLVRTQIQQWVKGTKTLDEYIQGHITRMDQLALQSQQQQQHKQSQASQ